MLRSGLFSGVMFLERIQWVRSRSEALRDFVRAHSFAVTLLIVLGIAWWVDVRFLASALREQTTRGLTILVELLLTEWATVRVVFLLPLLTVFLAFANLYLKISLRAPDIQRRLRPPVFWNVPFSIYVGVYMLLAILAYFAFAQKLGNWFIEVTAAALLGIGIGNADIKFGGFSLLPLAEFLQGLEAVVEAGISREVNEFDIAKRSWLRDRLAELVPLEVLERECRILGYTDQQLEELRKSAGLDILPPDAFQNNYKGVLAREIVKTSEANARRLIEESIPPRFRSQIYWRY